MSTQKLLMLILSRSHRSPDLTGTGILTKEKNTMSCISQLPVPRESEGTINVMVTITSSADKPKTGKKYQDLKVQIIKFIFFT